MYIQNYKMVYTMKVLPIKLKPKVYQDLKYVAQATDRSMAAIIRSHFVEPVTKEAAKIKQEKSHKLSLSEHLEKHCFKGKLYNQDKTIDELLYGGEENE